MLKKRLIFTLLYQEENFYLSRNFRLQKVGNLDWLKKNYNFSLITKSVDEIIILDVSRKNTDTQKFCKILQKFMKDCFVPLSVGGKIDSLKIAKNYIDAGADKLVLNTSLLNIKLIRELAKTFGEQCLIGSLDYKNKNDKIKFYSNGGSKEINLNLNSIFKKIKNLPIGEVILNSIDRDGTGNGYDFRILRKIPKIFNKPLIFSGGAGNYKHFLEGFKKKEIDALSTANLLNFVGDGLQVARESIINQGYKLAKW